MGWLTRVNEILGFAHEPIPELTTVDGVITARDTPENSWIQTISKENALTVPAVLRGRNLVCSISTLPLKLYDTANQSVRSDLLHQLDPNVPNVATLAQTVEDLLFHGIAWWRVLQRDTLGFPTKIERVDPHRVHLNPPPGAEGLNHLPSGVDPHSVVWVDTRVVPARDMKRFDSPNPPLLTAARRAIMRALKFEVAAERYADDPRPWDYFEADDTVAPPNDEAVGEFLDSWTAARRRRTTAYVPPGLKYEAVDVISPRDLQLVELQARASLEIANVMGLDPEDLGVSTTTRNYQNAVDRRRDRINDVLSMYMRAITDRLSMDDITRQGYRIEFWLDDYLRADPKTRAEVAVMMHGIGAQTVNEIRESDGRAPLPPSEIRALTAPMKPEGEKVQASVTVGSEHFSDDQAGEVFSATFTNFQVDPERRVIEGLALPYGSPSSAKSGVKYLFTRGTATWNKSAVSRVKLLRDHQWSNPLGAATEIMETDAGLYAKFKVARGPEGDRALELAADGVLDGLSIGTRPGMVVGPISDDGVRTVHSATIQEISLTPSPAFDDARLLSVTASTTTTTKGETMENEETTAPVAVAFTADDLKKAFSDAVTELRAAAGPVDVNPHGTVAHTQVNEASPYRFNGERGEYEFSTDVFAMVNGQADAETVQRFETFIGETFATATTDVTSLNPVGNRPEMYVDQKQYTYPVWAAINKGTIKDNTPFTFPKFANATNLVNDHVEGTEPSLGTFTTTLDTVTPSPVSGKVEINREVVDQGGNPQVSSLIWNKMVQAWYEALEAKAVALLDAASPTAINLGVADPEGAATALESAFVDLQYIRGGFRMDTLFLQVDLFKALASAVDSTGRKLYPILAPQNATGYSASRYRSINVGGVVGYPAWALGPTSAGVESSYLLDTADVHGWASAPRKLDFDIQVKSVYMGLWGYAATVISDLTGVREITYDGTA